MKQGDPIDNATRDAFRSAVWEKKAFLLSYSKDDERAIFRVENKGFRGVTYPEHVLVRRTESGEVVRSLLPTSVTRCDQLPPTYRPSNEFSRKRIEEEFRNADGVWEAHEKNHTFKDYCPKRGASLFTVMDGNIQRTVSIWRDEDGTYFRKQEQSGLKKFPPQQSLMKSNLEGQKLKFGVIALDPYERERDAARKDAFSRPRDHCTAAAEPKSYHRYSY